MKHSHTSVELRRLVLFALVGALNTAVCFALFALLVYRFAWHYDLALLADYAFGIVLGFVLHRVSTFADRKHVRRAFGKYTVTLIATFLANVALLDALVRSGLLDPLAAQAVALSLVTLASYLVQKHWVFRSHARLEGSQSEAASLTTRAIAAAPPTQVVLPAPSALSSHVERAAHWARGKVA